MKVIKDFYKNSVIGVYRLVWETGHFYIGRSVDIHKRYEKHCDDMIKGKHFNSQVTEIYNYTKKIPRLEIIQQADDTFQLYIIERDIIAKEKKDDKCLNTYSYKDRTPIKKHSNKLIMERRILIDELSRKEFKKIIDKYGTVDKALLRLLEIDK